jgi:DNA-directed RNA polymerase specialized sigma24 family protein
MARVLTRHRQEWIYAMRIFSEADTMRRSDRKDDGRSIYSLQSTNTLSSPWQTLRDAVASLTEPDRALITRLFWEGQTEADVAKTLGIGRRAVNKRKHAVMRSLKFAVIVEEGAHISVPKRAMRGITRINRKHTTRNHMIPC